MEVQSSSSFKVRALLQQLRPHLLQVIGTPEFRNCRASHEIRKDVELLLRFYKQMIQEMNKTAGMAVQECHSSDRPGSMPVKENKRQKLFQPVHVQKERENDGLKTVLSSNKKPLEGSYIVGGSVSGWNFITFRGTEPIYYGVTKESFRSSHKEVRIAELSV